MFSSLGTAMSTMKSVLFFVIDQQNVRPKVKLMLVSLNREVPEDLGVVIPDNFFWFYSPVFTVLKVVLRTYGPVYIGDTMLCLSVYSVPASLLQPLVIRATVSACCLHNLHLESCTVW